MSASLPIIYLAEATDSQISALFNPRKMPPEMRGVFIYSMQMKRAIAKEDYWILKNLGTSYEEIAMKLEERVRTLDPSKVTHFAKEEKCPFCPYSSPVAIKYNLIITSTGETVTINKISIHFLKNHHYLATPGEFRLEPSVIVKL